MMRDTNLLALTHRPVLAVLHDDTEMRRSGLHQ
jgi:hypothetical protein